jgi:hypothetical protein
VELHSFIIAALDDPLSAFDVAAPPESAYTIVRVGAAALQGFADLCIMSQRVAFPSLASVPSWVVDLKMTLSCAKEVAVRTQDSQLSGFVNQLRDSVERRFADLFMPNNPTTRAVTLSAKHQVNLPKFLPARSGRDALWAHLADEACAMAQYTETAGDDVDDDDDEYLLSPFSSADLTSSSSSSSSSSLGGHSQQVAAWTHAAPALSTSYRQRFKEALGILRSTFENVDQRVLADDRYDDPLH